MGKLADFLDSYNPEETKRNYGSAIRTFLAFKYGFTLHKTHVSLKILEKQRAEAEYLVERYFTEHDVKNDDDRQKIIDDFKKYTSWTANRYTPKSCQYYHAALKQFFEYHGLDIHAKDRKEIKRRVKKGGPETKEVLVSKEDIRKILMHSPLKLQALVLLIASSGLRINEAVTLELDDIELHEDDGRIFVRSENTKNKFSRITFCGKECVICLKEWLSVREKYLDGVEKRLYTGNKTILVSSSVRRNRVFGFGDVHARDMLIAALKKAGLYKVDNRTHRSMIHFHSFRKFFATTTNDVIPSMYVEIMMGHQSALDKSYKIPNNEKLREMYLRGEPYLRIYDESAEEIVKTKEEIKETKDRIRDMQLDHLMTKSKMDDIIKQNEKMQRELAILTRAAEVAESK
jgi:integrase